MSEEEVLRAVDPEVEELEEDVAPVEYLGMVFEARSELDFLKQFVDMPGPEAYSLGFQDAVALLRAYYSEDKLMVQVVEVEVADQAQAD